MTLVIFRVDGQNNGPVGIREKVNIMLTTLLKIYVILYIISHLPLDNFLDDHQEVVLVSEEVNFYKII